MPFPNMYLLSSKQDREILISSNSMHFTLNSFYFMSYHFLLNKTLIYSFWLMFLTFVLTPFAFLISLPSTAIKEYIFGFSPANSLFFL